MLGRLPTADVKVGSCSACSMCHVCVCAWYVAHVQYCLFACSLSVKGFLPTRRAVSSDSSAHRCCDMQCVKLCSPACSSVTAPCTRSTLCCGTKLIGRADAAFWYQGCVLEPQKQHHVAVAQTAAGESCGNVCKSCVPMRGCLACMCTRHIRPLGMLWSCD